jgi:CBS domain-containing protein
MPTTRLSIVTTTLALFATACAGGATDDPQGAAEDPPGSETESASGEHGDCIPLAEFDDGDVDNAPIESRDFPWNRSDPAVLEGFDFSRIISGGPPPDGIVPIDEPCFDTIATADGWLQAQSPVMVVEVDGDQRAYPLAIMTQHEIVNDVIGGVPVVVTYCPLCNSGLAFERTVDGQVLDFGTSGRLFQANLVMYDRQTKSLWTQFTGRAVVGEDFVGTELVRVPTALLGWEDFKQAAPDGHVLSRASMPGRDYGRNPYPGYEGSGDRFLFEGPRDERLPPNSRVVGLGTDRDPVAIALGHLRDERVVDVEVDGQPVTVWWASGQASALDTSAVDEGQDVGSTAAFVPVLDDGTQLDFAPSADDESRFVDEQTGSTWNLLGEAVAGELQGTQLEAIARDDTFWFVWFAFQPDTEIVGGDAADG